MVEAILTGQAEGCAKRHEKPRPHPSKDWPPITTWRRPLRVRFRLFHPQPRNLRRCSPKFIGWLIVLATLAALLIGGLALMAG
jgi:hypothetical protein